MVIWKGKIDREHGGKAYNLDHANLEAPNFFVITSEEVKEIFSSRDPQEVLNKSVEIDGVEEAYDDVGMSSEVRNASSRARNLVGGQRNNTRVSIRVSDDSNADFELDVGKGELEDSLKRVVASYFEQGGENYPNILIQKMIEPDYTGALIKGEKDYIEVVEGLGLSLEEGSTVPTMFSVGEEVEARIPDEQLKVTRNPMTSGYRERKIEPERPFDRSEIIKLSEKTDESIKFVYKRGSFFVVDRFEAERYSQDLKYVQVSPGKIKGIIGREIDLKDEPAPPEEYGESVIAKKGGYTSNNAKKARNAGKPAIFSYSEAQEGMKFGETESVAETDLERNGRAATQISTISELESGFNPEKAYLRNYSEVFSFNSREAILDARYMDENSIVSALKYISGDITVLTERPDREMLYTVVENGFSLGVPAQKIDIFEEELEVIERKFILNKLRELE